MKTIIFIFFTFNLITSSLDVTAQKKYTDSIHISGTIVNENNIPLSTAFITAKRRDRTLGDEVVFQGGQFSLNIAVPDNKEFQIYASGFGYSKQLIATLKSPTADINFDTIRLKYPISMPNETIIIACPPMFDMYEGGNSRTFTSDEIEKGAY